MPSVRRRLLQWAAKHSRGGSLFILSYGLLLGGLMAVVVSVSLHFLWRDGGSFSLLLGLHLFFYSVWGCFVAARDWRIFEDTRRDQ